MHAQTCSALPPACPSCTLHAPVGLQAALAQLACRLAPAQARLCMMEPAQGVAGVQAR